MNINDNFYDVYQRTTIDGYDLIMTSNACPEQYDVFKDGQQVGYLRLRHGKFTVRVPDVGGEVVYEACPAGDGNFDINERDMYLRNAIEAIGNHCHGDPKKFSETFNGEVWNNFEKVRKLIAKNGYANKVGGAGTGYSVNYLLERLIEVLED